MYCNQSTSNGCKRHLLQFITIYRHQSTSNGIYYHTCKTSMQIFVLSSSNKVIW